ncbi:MAG: Hsp20/alpha crystallin family protein [Cytophagales bacterium]|nr:Hsp20/alpha crystallin family protein [Cytophagales bacterium]
MTLVKRFTDPFESVPSLFDDFLTRDIFNRSALRNQVPAVNIREDNENFYVELAAPGLKKEDFKLELENNVLSISSEVKTEQEDKNNGYTRREFSYSSFKRSFTLPERVVDDERIQAHYEDGVLLLTVPKREEAKQKGPKVINIG